VVVLLKIRTVYSHPHCPAAQMKHRCGAYTKKKERDPPGLLREPLPSDHRSPAGDQLENQHYKRHYEEKMDIPRHDVETDQPY
jgi:hypothetical protein